MPLSLGKYKLTYTRLVNEFYCIKVEIIKRRAALYSLLLCTEPYSSAGFRRMLWFSMWLSSYLISKIVIYILFA
jgi:hypothetical protein